MINGAQASSERMERSQASPGCDEFQGLDVNTHSPGAHDLFSPSDPDQIRILLSAVAPSEPEQHSGWSGIRDNNADTAPVRDSQRPPETGHVECHDAVILTLTPTLVIIPISTWKYVYPIENIWSSPWKVFGFLATHDWWTRGLLIWPQLGRERLTFRI